MIFLRNVLRARWRSAITAVAVAAGVTLFTTIVTITQDLQGQIDGASAQYRADLVISERRATSPMHSRISAAQMDALRAELGEDLTPLVVGTLNESWNPYALLVGAEPRFVRQVPVVQGRPIEPGRAELGLGELAAERLGLRPGQHVSLGGASFEVAGVYRSGSRVFDSGMLVDIGTAQRLLFRESSARPYSVAALRVGSARPAEAVMREIHARHPQLRAVPGTELSGALRLIRVVRSLVGAIGFVAILGTALVLANTLLMAVAERTREIGILMTVGWSPWRVLRLLGAECLLLAVLGAALGDLGAVAVLHVLNRLPSVGFGWFPLVPSVDSLALSLAVAVGVALSAMVWPAVVVMRLQPLTALRHE